MSHLLAGCLVLLCHWPVLCVPLLGSDPHFSSIFLSMLKMLLHLFISAVDFSDYRCIVLWADDMAVDHLWGFWSLCPQKPCHVDSSSPTVHVICHAQRNKDLSDRSCSHHAYSTWWRWKGSSLWALCVFMFGFLLWPELNKKLSLGTSWSSRGSTQNQISRVWWAQRNK